MTRWQALCLLVILWAGIYLPGLGSTEIKGEEGRRILPAIAMLDSGNWIVPSLNGVPYLRKPPLSNWTIAASMWFTGQRDEWAARLPSVLGVLALGVATVLLADGWLRTEHALIAALFMITNISMIEKGRLAEIDALYVSLCGIAIVWWIAWNRKGRSPWATWIFAWIFLALALLTKAPLHLVYFYAVIGAILFHQGRLRELIRLPHFVGIAIGLGIVLIWLIPYLQMTKHGEAAGTWKDQMIGRFTENQFDLKSWLLSVPRGLSNFIPWILLIPILWRRELLHRLSAADLAILRGGRFAVVACFAFLLIPGFLVRYSMPLLVPASLLLAMVLQEPISPALIRGWRGAVLLTAGLVALAGIAGPFVSGARLAVFCAAAFALLTAIVMWRQRESLRTPVALTTATGFAMAAAAFVYTAAVLPRVIAAENVRPVGEAIAAAVPKGETIYAFDLDYQLEIYYLRDVEFLADLDAPPADLHWLLTHRKKLGKVLKKISGASIALEFDKADRSLVLVEVTTAPARGEAP